LISISFCTLSSVTFTISPLTIPNTSVLITISKVTDESVQKEIDINTELLGIVNSEVVKVTDESVHKEIDINIEVLGIIILAFIFPLILNSVPSAVCTVVFVSVSNSFRLGNFEKKKVPIEY
jgi:hypothetical protein